MIKRNRLVAMNQHYKNFSLDYFLDAQQKLGIKNIELWMSMQHFPLDSVTYGDCRKLLKKLHQRNLNIVSATFPSCDFQYQYSCQEKEYRKKCINYFLKGLEAAESLGAQIVTANSGWGYWNRDEHEGLQATIEVLEAVTAAAEKRKLTVVLETLTADESNLVNRMHKLKELKDRLDTPALKIMIDTVAMMQAGETMEAWFQMFGRDITYMHFVDGKRSWEHLAWGDGEYPLEQFLEIMEQYEYTGYLSQELITESYLKDPLRADEKNLCALNKYIE